MSTVLADGTTARSKVLRTVLVIVIAAWLVVPLAVVVGLSFTGQQSFVFPPRSWSLDWYRALADPKWLAAAGNSLVIGASTAVLAAVLGTAASFALVRSRSRILRSLRVLVLAPQIIPVVIVALGVYLLFLRWHLVGTYLGFILAYTGLALPFVVIPVTAALETFDRNLEKASASLGAGPFTTFRHVTLPLIRPAVLGGAAIAFLSAFDEVVVGLYLSSAQLRTLPVEIFRSMTDRVDPSVAAIAAVEITLVVAGVVVALAVQRRRALLLLGKEG
ncbi:ABC transporter permease [Amycolatopsis jejuensis]|uniref:ABC transporter permease n=1 Tax=Amycolatopsis jejuensis TaxID=330084 RepID=UPI000691BFA7|nr:ABC transporter permease [Amycolatopsis jejuensis]